MKVCSAPITVASITQNVKICHLQCSGNQPSKYNVGFTLPVFYDHYTSFVFCSIHSEGLIASDRNLFSGFKWVSCMQAILIFSFSSLALRGIFLQHSIEGYGEAVYLFAREVEHFDPSFLLLVDEGEG